VRSGPAALHVHLTLCLNSGVGTNTYESENSTEFLDYNCTCKFPFYERNCQLMLDLCEAKNCSMRGFCKVKNRTETVCQCYDRNEGTNCEIVSERLVNLQKVVRGSVIVSSVLIVLFYTAIILADIHTLLIVKDVRLNACCVGKRNKVNLIGKTRKSNKPVAKRKVKK
jgi:hypothetical protein